MQSDGLIFGNHWGSVKEVVDLYQKLEQPQPPLDDTVRLKQAAKAVGENHLDIHKMRLTQECLVVFLQMVVPTTRE